MRLAKSRQDDAPASGVDDPAANRLRDHPGWIMAADQKRLAIETGRIQVNAGLERTQPDGAVIPEVDPDHRLGTGGADDQRARCDMNRMDIREFRAPDNADRRETAIEDQNPPR